MEGKRKITIGHLYPDLLNLYGDRGNIACMMQRCRWRGIEAETIEYNLGDEIDFGRLDIVLLGGGSDREQMIVCRKLQEIQEAFQAYVEDLYTEQGEGRLIDNIVLQSDLVKMPVAGFENHGGRTYINGNKPFGKVLYGSGNDGESGYEGVVYKNVIGTYLHGPLLPKNPEVCDWLISRALERKYGESRLSPLDDSHEIEANSYVYQRFVGGNQ